MENTQPTPKGHPKGLYLLFVTEMAERFSYYGMRAIFILYLTKALMYDKAFAADGLYGGYTSLVYLTPLLGGYISDRFWGNRRSIIFGGILMAIGQLLMFTSGSVYANTETARLIMYGGLVLLIIGNGFFKPNISTMVGQLYPAGDKRVDSAFTIFYMGINLGAFFAPLVCGFFGDTGSPADFKWGFLAAGVGMIISVIIFVILKDKYIVTPEGRAIGGVPTKNGANENTEEAEKNKIEFGGALIGIWSLITVALFALFYWVIDFDFVGSAIFSLGIGIPGLIISDKKLTKVDRQRIWVIYIIAFFVIFFWSAFEQAGASLTFFAEEQTDRMVGNTKIPASFFQSINAIDIVLFAPLFTLIWMALSKRNMEPASPVKQSLGLLLLALGYVVIAFGVKGMVPDEKKGMWLLVTLYTIHTFGELCLSPIGLSMVVKLAPIKFASLLMGVWFLSSAVANKTAGTLSALYPEDVKKVATVKINSSILNISPNGENNKLQITDGDSIRELDMTEGNVVTKAKKDLKDVYSAPLHPTTKVEPYKVKKSLFKEENPFVVRDRKELDKDVYGDGMIEMNKRHHDSVKDIAVEKIRVFTTADSKYLVIMRTDMLNKANKDKSVEVWDIATKKPKIMGFEIENLYDFFMIFVVSAGAAAIILFLISRRLLKMMHGIR